MNLRITLPRAVLVGTGGGGQGGVHHGAGLEQQTLWASVALMVASNWMLRLFSSAWSPRQTRDAHLWCPYGLVQTARSGQPAPSTGPPDSSHRGHAFTRPLRGKLISSGSEADLFHLQITLLGAHPLAGFWRDSLKYDKLKISLGRYGL